MIRHTPIHSLSLSVQALVKPPLLTVILIRRHSGHGIWANLSRNLAPVWKPAVKPTSTKKALFALLVVTSVWGATFIWMKQALNALEPEIQELGRFQVVAILVAARFAVAAIACCFSFPKPERPCVQQNNGEGAYSWRHHACWLCHSNDWFRRNQPFRFRLSNFALCRFYRLITVLFTKSQPSRTLILGVLLATFGAGFIQGPPHLTWGLGEILTVICAVFFALHIIYTQKITQQLEPSRRNSDLLHRCNSRIFPSLVGVWWRQIGFPMGSRFQRWSISPSALPRYWRFVLLLAFTQYFPTLFTPNSSSHYLCT